MVRLAALLHLLARAAWRLHGRLSRAAYRIEHAHADVQRGRPPAHVRRF